MAKFWYDTILPIFGEKNVRLLYSGKKIVYVDSYIKSVSCARHGLILHTILRPHMGGGCLSS